MDYWTSLYSLWLHCLGQLGKQCHILWYTQTNASGDFPYPVRLLLTLCLFLHKVDTSIQIPSITTNLSTVCHQWGIFDHHLKCRLENSSFFTLLFYQAQEEGDDDAIADRVMQGKKQTNSGENPSTSVVTASTSGGTPVTVTNSQSTDQSDGYHGVEATPILNQDTQQLSSVTVTLRTTAATWIPSTEATHSHHGSLSLWPFFAFTSFPPRQFL